MSIRIGGPVPFGQQEQQIALGPGGVMYLPPGNFLVTLGLVTVLQSFDPFALQWRTFGPPNMDEVPVESDGYNWRLINQSGIVVGASITNAGSGGVNGIGAAATGVNVTFAAPAAGQAATAYPIVGGALSAPTITQAGSGFLVPPLILIDPPPFGGVQATAVATINAAGAINAVTLTQVGAGYTSVPNYYVIPQFSVYPGAVVPPNLPGFAQTAVPPIVPPGQVAAPLIQGVFNYGLTPAFPTSAGALITSGALTGSGTLTAIVMQTAGSNYLGTAIPAITITGAGAAAATALMSMSLTGITITNGGAAYGAAPNIESSLGLIAQTHNNNLFLPRAARAVSTLAAGVINGTVIEDPGFGFQKIPILGTIMTGGTPATTEATLTAVIGGINDVCFIQPAVQ